MTTMKKILHYTLGLCLLAFTACDEDGTNTILQPQGEISLSASKETVVLSLETAAETAIVFQRTDADYGFPAAVTYTLEVDKKADNFASPRILVLDTAHAVALTVTQLNDMLLAEELQPMEAGDVIVRVRSDVSTSVTSLYSNTLALKVTPYISEPPYLTVYLVGPAAEFAWDEFKAVSVFRDADNAFAYTYTGHLNAGDLKVLGYQGKWAPLWGYDGSKVVFREEESDPDPAAFSVPTAGYYTFTLDLLRMRYSLTPYDEAPAADYGSMSIAGDFSGWALIPMANTAFNPHIWTVDYTFTTDADKGFKFVGDNWVAQWGTVGKDEKLYGTAIPAGNDDKIELAPGEYTLVFNDLTKQFVLIPKE
jgi:starch-binding outer membrane protein SusE/F